MFLFTYIESPIITYYVMMLSADMGGKPVSHRDTELERTEKKKFFFLLTIMHTFIIGRKRKNSFYSVRFNSVPWCETGIYLLAVLHIDPTLSSNTRSMNVIIDINKAL